MAVQEHGAHPCGGILRVKAQTPLKKRVQIASDRRGNSDTAGQKAKKTPETLSINNNIHFTSEPHLQHTTPLHVEPHETSFASQNFMLDAISCIRVMSIS
jgi:hypothetical protein